MVYESDFYTTRRTRPTVSSYSVTTTPTTPRHYVVLDTPGRGRTAEQQYSYSYTTQQDTSSTSRGGASGYTPRTTSTYSSTEERNSRGTGPGTSSYSSERTSRSSDGPGSYSYSSVPPRYVFRRSMSPVPSYTTTYAIPRFTRAHSPVVISAPIHRPRATSPILNYKRIVQVPIVSSRVGRNAAYIAEMNRIGHRLRPRVGSEPCEDFLNSEAIVSFDDETRAIRARTKELLRRVNEPIPRSYYPDYQPPRELEYTPEPLSHDEYIEQRVFSPMRHVHQDINTISRFNEPARQYIGKGHLACISFAGGRPMDRRRAMPRCDEDRNVRDDIKFLSHYNRARAAAIGPVASLDAIKGGPGKETAAPEATCISCNSNCATAAYKKANETAAAAKTP